jgi:hypothetical protein
VRLLSAGLPATAAVDELRSVGDRPSIESRTVTNAPRKTFAAVIVLAAFSVAALFREPDAAPATGSNAAPTQGTAAEPPPSVPTGRTIVPPADEAATSVSTSRHFRAVDEAGEPIPHASARDAEGNRHSGDAHGVIAVPLAGGGVAIVADGYRAAFADVANGGPPSAPTDVRLVRGHTLSGVVVDHCGRPVVGAEVSAIYGQAAPTRARHATASEASKPEPDAVPMSASRGVAYVVRAHADSAGRFALSGLTAGPHGVEATAPGYAPLRSSPRWIFDPAQETGVELQMTRVYLAVFVGRMETTCGGQHDAFGEVRYVTRAPRGFHRPSEAVVATVGDAIRAAKAARKGAVAFVYAPDSGVEEPKDSAVRITADGERGGRHVHEVPLVPADRFDATQVREIVYVSPCPGHGRLTVLSPSAIVISPERGELGFAYLPVRTSEDRHEFEPPIGRYYLRTLEFEVGLEALRKREPVDVTADTPALVDLRGVVPATGLCELEVLGFDGNGRPAVDFQVMLKGRKWPTTVLRAKADGRVSRRVNADTYAVTVRDRFGAVVRESKVELTAEAPRATISVVFRD